MQITPELMVSEYLCFEVNLRLLVLLAMLVRVHLIDHNSHI